MEVCQLSQLPEFQLPYRIWQFFVADFLTHFPFIFHMVPKKSRSKRKTIRQQYTARKLVVVLTLSDGQYFERKRKEKKQAKRAARAGKVIQKQRDPGIPNSWPFKEELLQEV